jgi:AcrR family transcriptional regulator
LVTERRYRQVRRAAKAAETKRRITEAAVELHGTVGPARTTVADIARRARVQRLTVYKHFPDLTSLFAACTTHFFAGYPMPPAEQWAAIEDPRERLNAALCDIYTYYSEHEAMFANWLRDAQIIPELAPFAEAGYMGYLESVRDVLCREQSSPASRALLMVTLHFGTWRLLTGRDGLSDEAAAALMAEAVVRA